MSESPDRDNHLHTDDPSVADEVNTVVVGVMPWVISLTMHAALVILAIFFIWTNVPDEPPADDFDVFISQGPKPVSPLVATKQTTSNAASDSLKRMLPRSPGLSGNNSMIGAGNRGVGTGMVGVPGPEKSPQVFAPSGTRIGTSTDFMGIKDQATRLAYLIDASGSMIETMPFVTLELKRSIGKLSEKQSFTVIFFQENDAVEVPTPSTGLKKASKANRDKVIDWISRAENLSARGKSNPVPAMRLALKYAPQLMFVLSDDITGSGRYEVDQRNLLADIRRNNEKNTKIHTIQFLYEDKLAEAIGLDGSPLGASGRTLFKISDMTGGKHKFLDAAELGVR